MRIAFAHSFYSSHQPSGENRVVEQQIAALRRVGHSVSLIDQHTDEGERRKMYPLQVALTVASCTQITVQDNRHDSEGRPGPWSAGKEQQQSRSSRVTPIGLGRRVSPLIRHRELWAAEGCFFDPDAGGKAARSLTSSATGRRSTFTTFACVNVGPSAVDLSESQPSPVRGCN